ncbi:MAG: hypothetical protein ACOX4K_08745 [Bacillota bacterium]|jgi:hypothetical protein
MKRWLQKHFQHYMIRPTIYKALSYFLVALVFVLVWDRFVNTEGLSPMSYAYTVLGLFFLAAAWLSYLRLDGIKVPFLRLMPVRKKQPFASFMDMSDYVDIEIVSFEELAEEERNICCLLANIICGAIYLTLSLV